ncbi:hypothetical protein CHS0354_031596 [Potamilus streckersoni]|uniref:Uncharacterized protein n=1 Tax=Potamilus streckersoni TaxID=2493646 RepID=A0AAE0SGH4_9BIVA|nr:hypothetical protein CHS0354_031596 [Potamilus streckersoni]
MLKGKFLILDLPVSQITALARSKAILGGSIGIKKAVSGDEVTRYKSKLYLIDKYNNFNNTSTKNFYDKKEEPQEQQRDQMRICRPAASRKFITNPVRDRTRNAGIPNTKTDSLRTDATGNKKMKSFLKLLINLKI